MMTAESPSALLPWSRPRRLVKDERLGKFFIAGIAQGVLTAFQRSEFD
jgi:hypothetical protein